MPNNAPLGGAELTSVRAGLARSEKPTDRSFRFQIQGLDEIRGVRFFRRDRIEPFLAKIDIERLREIQRRYAGSTDRYAKYADVKHWLKINLPRVQELELDRSPPKKILDLGCGAGFFLFLARQFGHKCLGLDVGDFPLSNELIELFGLERVTSKIRAFEPLPDFGRKFDLITAFSAAFNRSEDESRGWNPDEWKFFLDDLDQYLKPGGEMLIEITSGKDKRYVPAEVRDFFLKRGARVDGERVFLGYSGTRHSDRKNRMQRPALSAVEWVTLPLDMTKKPGAR